MANKIIQMKDGNDNIYPRAEGYKAGDTVSLAGENVFAGFFRTTDSVRFSIPLQKPILATSVTITGTLILRNVKGTGSATYTIGTNATASGVINQSGIAVLATFTSTPTDAVALQAVSVQPGLTLTFA